VLGMNIKIPSPVDAVVSRIAKWSFSAYLTNLPVLLSIKYFLPVQSLSVMSCVLLWMLYVIVTFFTAFLIYELYERKFLALRERIS
jgi:peptidoglycan/LPS O-acetylase OafA/YrhL